MYESTGRGLVLCSATNDLLCDLLLGKLLGMVDIIAERLQRLTAGAVLIQKDSSNGCLVFQHSIAETLCKAAADAAFAIGDDGDIGIFIPLFHKAHCLCQWGFKIRTATKELLRCTKHILWGIPARLEQIGLHMIRMDMLNDDATIEAIIATVLDLLDRENVNLPLYEQQLRETETGIENLLNAIQQGILTKSTKTRLEELESTKEDLEIKILNEKLAKPKIEPEFLRMYLLKFRQLERDKEEHRKMLVDTFINAIFLYDDKLVITFNYRDGSKTITLRDINETIFRENLGSDIECCGVPKKQIPI